MKVESFSLIFFERFCVIVRWVLVYGVVVSEISDWRKVSEGSAWRMSGWNSWVSKARDWV